MHLSQLKLSGFKSYSETVQVDFSPVIAVIIGNNGAGKSNALEAIVWALGEDDTRALRAARPEDLLFAGSRDNPAADQARVEVVLENGQGGLSLQRTLDRQGRPGFLVNGEQVADLAAYRQALEELGLGRARFNLIRQEQLGDLFTFSPAQLARFLEGYLAPGQDLAGVEAAFQANLGLLIPGSQARLVSLEQGEPGLGLEVVFPDKGAKQGHLLSGGERAVAALALKLALFEQQPSPFYLLDEVEPSLDWSRNQSTQKLLKGLAAQRQLIIITHLRSTIQMAETVHGVRLRPDGSSWLKFHFHMDERLFKVYKCC